jgi:hypothetical protein
MIRWLRREPGRREQAVALGVALGAAVAVAGVAFYLTRLFHSREEIERADDREGSRALPPAREEDSSRTLGG